MHNLPKNFFKNCESLTSIILPNTTLSIGDQAFSGCARLKEADIGTGVKFIGLSAFSNNAQLTSIDRLDDSDGSHTFDVVRDYAFAGTGLKKANLSLRSSSIYTFWGDGCFQNCKQLQYVHFLSANYMSRNMFKGCTSLVSVDYNVSMMAYTYPGIFNGCTSLKAVNMPAQLLFVPEGTFRGCTNLMSATFNTYGANSSIDEIQKDAYYGTRNLTALQFPQSIDSLDELDLECFRGASGLDIVKFHGIGPDQISVEVKYDIPSENYDIRLNEWYTFEEPYYSLFSTYDSYSKSKIDTDSDYYISEADYNKEVAKAAKNYTTLQSIVQAGIDLKIPVLLTIGITKQDDQGGYFYTPQDLVVKGVQYDGFWGNEDSELGGVYPSNKLSVKIGTTNFKCDYLYDQDLVESFLVGDAWGWTDPKLQAERKDMGYTDAEINRYVSYVQAGKTKQQLSAIFISYNINLGYIKAWTDTDYKKSDPWEKPSQYISKLKTAIKSRLTKLTGKLTGTLRDSGFKSINQSFFNTNSGVHSTLKSYDNYGIICVKHGSTINKRANVVFSNNISSEDAFQNLAEAEYTNLENKASSYEDSHPDAKLSYWYYNTNEAGQAEAGSMLNDICVYELKKRVGKDGYTIANLDESFCLPDGSALHDITVIRKCNMVDAIMTSGFFGLKHDVKVWCKGMPAGQYLQYQYNDKYYKEPKRIKYESNKTAVANFKVGTWYYNAQNVYEEARRLGMPCLFIYSLWGCGPCAIYQKKLWNNEEFQDWFKKQKFLLCGLECEQQPMYDKHLQFLVDNISVNAKNFAKEDQGEIYASKPTNALGAKFRRYAIGNSTASTLMTPVLIFMDKDGNCWDYSYHNLSLDIRRFNVKGMIQRLKSLCLYHFDGNVLANSKYVVDAGKVFNASDYAKSADNPWQVGSNVMNMSTSIHTEDYDYEAVMTPQQLEQSIVSVLMTVPQYAAVMTGNKHPYMAGCLFGNVDWILPMFPDIDIMEYTEASQINTAFNSWYFKIGDLYYKMTFNSSDKKQIKNPCGDGMEWIFKASFSQVSYPG